jgi:hypothetical protein
VTSKIPKLIDEGKDRDQAVAQAIAMCQEEGKCALTPDGKQAAYGEIFAAVDAWDGSKELAFDLTEAVTFEASETQQKQVTEGSQGEEQQPTTPIDGDVKGEDFGSPFLDQAKQTNVLLGSLISEMRSTRELLEKLFNEKAGAPVDDDLKSEDSVPKEMEESTEEKQKSALVDKAKKRLESLEKRLKDLGV